MEPAAQLVGRQVGDFRLVETIGTGGMGAAYRAEQVSLGREAVIKLIDRSSAPDTPEETRVRFLREAWLASQLDHPYAAHVYAFGAEPDGLLWIAMELVRGVPLDQMLAQQGAMSLARFVPLFDRLCEVVHSAHEQGIIHRDIKPANVMVVRRSGRLLPKLLDFGIARGGSLDVLEPTSATFVEDAIADTPLGAGSRSVTVRGRVVGSPHYMAPEQWVDATRATPRTDLYALAVTAYEMLTGRRPFDGASVLEVARAHARTEAAPVGPGLPAALDHVFARALAKRESERYGSVLELATAIRELARTTARGPNIDFDEVVRDTFIQSGPQPLAEALVELAAARDVTAAWEAGWRAVSVLVRVVGVTALAARARVGERDLGDKATRQVRTLVERGLDLDEWLAMAGAVTEPFATRPEAHPIPELVELLWDGGTARDTFGRLLALRRGEGADAEAVHGLLGELGAVLRACAFVTTYGWVRGTGDVWSGPRRQPRERRSIAGGLDSNSVWLVDADAVPVVELSPLVRIVPPSPGADDEAFVIDGPAKRGARSVAWPREFERHDDELREFVHRELARLGTLQSASDRDAAPYRGLAAFGPNDATMFFGREREVEALVNRLRVQPMLAVVGPSGVGKSSFVHAGVIPALPESWQTLSLRPGISPLAALEARLVAAGIAATGLAERLVATPAALGEILDDAARRQGTHLVIVIDQLEEMFTQCRDPTMRDRFSRALVEAGTRGERVHVIATLRDDFLVRAAELSAFGATLSGSLELITLPDEATLKRIIVAPLEQVGYRFETETMPDDMVAAVREHPGALALLSFAAAKLWELRDRGFRHIPQRAYEAIGGVAGALARHAEDTLSTLPAEDHVLVRELFRHLVTSEGTRAALRRSEAIQLLGKGPRAERAVEALVESRLIVGFEGDDKTDWIEVVHEALLTAWPRLVTWQREDAEAARLRDQVRSAARQWGERGRAKGLLWRGEALVEFRLWRARHDIALTDLEQEFAAASLADEARSRRLRRIALAAVVAGLAIGLAVVERANSIAQRNAAESRRVALASLVEQGRAALTSSRPQDAMVYLSAAYSRGATDPNLPFMLAVAEQSLGGEVGVLSGHTNGLKSVVISSDGSRIITSGREGAVRIWNARTTALEHSFDATGESPFTDATVTADGDILTWGDDKPAVWDAATGTRRFTLAVENGAIARLAEGGATIVTLDSTGVAAWHAHDGSARGHMHLEPAGPSPTLEVDGDRYAVLVAGGVAVGHLDFAAPPTVVATSVGGVFPLAIGGRWLAVTPEQSREVHVWDLDHLDTGWRVLSGHAGDVIASRFSHDGTRLATASMDHTVKVWDSMTGRMFASLDGHEGYVIPVEWSPDDREIATGSIDRTARLWNAETGAQLAVFYGHTDVVRSLAFDPSGERLVTASFDATARVFDIRPHARTIELHRDGPVAVRFSGDGKRLLAVGGDGSAWVIDVARQTIVATIDEYRVASHINRIMDFSLRVCGDIDETGETVVVPTSKGAAVIRVADRAHPMMIPLDGVSCARFAPHHEIALATTGGNVVMVGATGRVERTWWLHQDRVTDLEIDPRSGRLATSSDDGTARVVDVMLGPPLVFAAPAGAMKGVALAHHANLVATASQDTIARVFDVTTQAMQAASHSMSDLQDVDFSPDDLRIAVANTDGTLTIFDTSDGRVLARYGGAAGWVGSVAFSPRSDLLAAADDRGRIQILSVASETRSPADIAHYVDCHVPFELVDTHLIARVVARCTQ